MPRAIGDVQPIGDDDGDTDGSSDVNGFVRFVLESAFLGRVSLADGSRYRIGRNPGNAVVIDRDEVSTWHCILSVEAGALQIRRRVRIWDVDSDSGTYVNGEELVPYEKRWLAAGDEISLGRRTSFRLRSLY